VLSRPVLQRHPARSTYRIPFSLLGSLALGRSCLPDGGKRGTKRRYCLSASSVEGSREWDGASLQECGVVKLLIKPFLVCNSYCLSALL